MTEKEAIDYHGNIRLSYLEFEKLNKEWHGTQYGYYLSIPHMTIGQKKVILFSPNMDEVVLFCACESCRRKWSFFKPLSNVLDKNYCCVACGNPVFTS